MTIGSRDRASYFIALSSVLSAPVLFALGCARDKEPETQYIQGAQYGAQAGQAGVYAAGGAAGYGYGQPIAGQAAIPGTVPPGTPGTPLPGSPLPGSGGAPSTTPAPSPLPNAQPIDPAAASVVQPVINELARAHAVAGSKPLGSPLVGNFQTGQKLETTIQLQPQKCYTVVATALPPVTELNVQLVASTPIPNLNPVLAIDSETGSTAVIGKKPNCYKWAFPVPAPAKLVIEVVAGSGLAAAQVYEK
jgi:hypothetical protein